ncbi:hypothetical protein EFJ98_24685 [Pseudomonas putida]|nr:hypothetical protein EFJ98_24685 [Pseudomonas putida]
MVAVPFTGKDEHGEYKQEQRYMVDRKGRRIDIPDTVQRQTQLNKLAAVFSALAALSLAFQTGFQAMN